MANSNEILATGRRKCAVARVRMVPGTGKVTVNGKNCVIKRGVWTRIRRKFALLIDQSEIQDLRTAELIAGESLRFESATRQRGL